MANNKESYYYVVLIYITLFQKGKGARENSRGFSRDKITVRTYQPRGVRGRDPETNGISLHGRISEHRNKLLVLFWERITQAFKDFINQLLSSKRMPLFVKYFRYSFPYHIAVASASSLQTVQLLLCWFTFSFWSSVLITPCISPVYIRLQYLLIDHPVCTVCV